jgi:hypothetical protein
MPNVMRNARVVLSDANPPCYVTMYHVQPKTYAKDHQRTWYNTSTRDIICGKKKNELISTSNSNPKRHVQSRMQMNNTKGKISPSCLHHPNTPYYSHTARSVRCIGQSSAVDWVERPYRPDLDAYRRVGHQRVSWRAAAREMEGGCVSICAMGRK